MKKRIILSIIGLIAVICSLSCLSIIASAANVAITRTGKTVTTYTEHYAGTYSTLYAANGFTGITATNSSFLNSYKEAYYQEFGVRNGNEYYLLKDRFGDGFSDTVISNSKETVNSAVVKRIHLGITHLSSDYSSLSVDSLRIDVKKPNAP